MEGLAAMMYNKGEGNTITHYYAGKKPVQKKKQKKNQPHKKEYKNGR